MESKTSPTNGVEKRDCRMIKPSKVVFISDELERDFNSLKEDDPIKKGIVRAIGDLRENAFSGIQIPKRLIPKEYTKSANYSNILFALLYAQK